MGFLLVLCLTQAPAELGRGVDVVARVGLAMPAVSASPYVALGAGPAAQLEGVLRLSPMLATGLQLSGSWHPAVPATDGVPLAQQSGSGWNSNVAMVVRLTPPVPSRVEPFGAVRAGWLVSSFSHGPMVGLALGAEVHLTARVAVGLCLDAQGAFVSAAGWPVSLNGYVLRRAVGTTWAWGEAWHLTGFGSGLAHLRISL